MAPTLRLGTYDEDNPPQRGKVSKVNLFLEDAMKKSTIFGLILSLALAGPVLAQAPQAGAKPGAQAAGKPMIITGEIAKTEQGYIIQGRKPPELFTILNPNPRILDILVKSGKSVTIEATSVMGDNVNIQKIDGKAYQEGKTGKPNEN